MAESVLNNKPVTLAQETAEYKKMSEKELLAIIAENSRRTKGYIQAIAIIVLLNICVSFAMVAGIFMNAK
jgi:hypothetical protein